MTAGLGTLALLGGCGTRTRQTGFRDVSQPLSVTTRADLSALSGPWFVRGHFQGDASLAMVTFLPNYNGSPAIEYRTEGCLLSGDCTTETEVQPLLSLGPRRARDTGTGREIWLVWIDEGLRTAAIGTPDGSFGWVLDRAPKNGDDRILAAQEVLEFNGYNVSALSLKEIG
ncbi:MAG: lipocalin [Pseudomonadota bacterium]